MGILSLEPHSRLAAPDSPPGLVSPSSSSYSSRPSPPVEKLWNARFGPLSPPMSNYEHGSAADMSTAGKSHDDGSSRKSSAQSAPRQQLPSLSSLFGPPSSVRPLHSPSSDRPGTYPATSPLDWPRMPQSQGDRSYAASYFPPQGSSPTMSQPRSTYDARYDHERQALHGLPRSFSGSGSPRYREPEHPRPESRSEVGLDSSKWSMHNEAGKHEYALVSRESHPSLRATHDRISYQYPSNKDAGTSYRDHRPSSGSSLMQASAQASTSSSEGIPSKDGLGPKIWTGTHFLPRFVRAAEVPGEGMCYFYDDGSHCKTVIDGEAVNAHWGVTKAGKPRKRLAIACVTCREKKIKCDPDYPRCVQCEKFGRICKFKNAPRGGHNTSPSTPPAEPEDMRRMVGSTNPNDMHRPGSNSSASVSPRTTYRQPSPEPSMPHKRMRLGFDSSSRRDEAPMSFSRTPETAKTSISWQHRQPIELPRIHENLLNRAWQSDPYVSDPQSINTVISSFFVHTDSTMALRFLPETAFKSWVIGNAHTKSPEDLMLTYSILAVGVALSGGLKRVAHEYAQVARYAQHRIASGLQLVQTRLLLALYYLSISDPDEANAMSSAAISMATCLQLNLELDKSIDAHMTVFPYGLARAAYAESRRRTYWACFVLERLNGMFPNRLSILDARHIFIRLPCEAEVFEKQAESQAPFFSASPSRSSKLVDTPLSLSAYLVQLVDLWAKVMSNIYRAAQSVPLDRDAAPFIDNTRERFIKWQDSLPERFTYSADNMELAAQDGTLSTFLTVHLLHHHGLIKLYRHMCTWERLAPADRLQYLWRVGQESNRVLNMTSTLEVLLQARRTPLSAPPSFMSHVILEAADVVTAEGALSEASVLLDRLAGASAVVDAASTVWEEARAHRAALEHRRDAIRILLDSQPGHAPSAGGKVFINEDEGKNSRRLPLGLCWQMEEPMDTMFGKFADIVYTRS
ncbi:putative transcriptional regulatory protein [Colletotrichum tanaceti]|nr:putative transcriptional regulatory protein [Colletotrichum tanaceti]